MALVQPALPFRNLKNSFHTISWLSADKQGNYKIETKIYLAESDEKHAEKRTTSSLSNFLHCLATCQSLN